MPLVEAGAGDDRRHAIQCSPWLEVFGQIFVSFSSGIWTHRLRTDPVPNGTTWVPFLEVAPFESLFWDC